MGQKIIIIFRSILWGTCVFAFCYLAFFYIPRQGFDFTDRGYVLYNAMLLMRGVIPTAGFSSIINALFVWCIRKYYFFAFLYLIFFMGGLLIFWYSLYRKNIFSSLALPLVLIAAISFSLHNFIDYSGSPMLYLLYGLGFLLIGIYSEQRVKQNLFFILSAFFLNLSIFANISLLPMWGYALVGCYVLLKHTKHKKVFMISFVCLGLIFACFYFFSPLSIFKIHTSSYSFTFLVHKIFLLLILLWRELITIKFLIAIGCGFILLLLSHFNLILKQNIQLLLKFLFFITVVVFLLEQAHILSGYEWRYSYLHLIFHSIQAGVLSRIPVLRYVQYLVFFSTFLAFYIFLIAVIFSLLKKNRLKILIISGFVIGYTIGLAVTTTSSFEGHISNMFPIYFLLTCFIFETYDNSSGYLNRVMNFIAYCFLIFMAGFGLYLHSFYVYRSYSAFSPKIKVTSGVFSGLFINQKKLESINTMMFMYKKHHCQNKYFLAYPSMPLLYWVFNRRAPLDQAWISPTVGSIKNPQVLINILKQKKHWCVFHALSMNHASVDFFQSLGRFLESKSRVMEFFHIKPDHASPVYYPNKVRLYVK